MTKKDLTPLSQEEQDARKPLPPEFLVDALQDSLPHTTGKARAAKTTRSRKQTVKPTEVPVADVTSPEIELVPADFEETPVAEPEIVVVSKPVKAILLKGNLQESKIFSSREAALEFVNGQSHPYKLEDC